ncbi:MAG: hypothetical protein J2P46_10855, partial [Zavarzinella sp.]|nr:hypothetical protein [Zavarzinella sp.]
ATPVVMTDEGDLPVALPVDTPMPGFERPKGGFSPLFILLLALFISTTVYILGKNFLFAN